MATRDADTEDYYPAHDASPPADVDGQPLAVGDAVELVTADDMPWPHLDGRRGVVHHYSGHEGDPNLTVIFTPDDPYFPGVVTRASHFRKVEQ